jgi:hypothetical protein
MAFKLVDWAQTRWRTVNAPPRRANPSWARYSNGKLIELRSKSHDTPILSPIVLPARRRGARSLGAVSAATDKGHHRHLTRPPDCSRLTYAAPS